MAWTPDRVDTLKKMWSEGRSASEIAAHLGEVTRNSVIGKVFRLNLAARRDPSENQPRAKKQKAPPKVRQERQAPKAKSVSIPREPKPVIVFEPPAPPLPGQAVRLLDLQSGMCKWPIGDPAKEDFHFCGHRSLVSLSYCEYHARIAYVPAMPRGARKAAA